MHRSLRYLGPVLLAGALLAPVTIRARSLPNPAPPATPAQQDRDRDRNRGRVYDRDHRDYHDWDDREERAYRNWLAERNQRYLRYQELDRRRQSDYWRWRHEHANWEGPRRVYDSNRRAWIVWDEREDRAYRRWLAERRENFIEFELLPRGRQVIYFRWRSSHRD